MNRARSASAASEFETLGIETAFQSAKTDTNNLSNPTSSGRGSWYPPSELRRRQLDAATTSRAASGFSRRLPWILDADAGFGRRVRAPKAEVIGSRAIALRSKKVDTVRKAEVIGSVHDDVCTHRSRATVQNCLAQKPGFYAESVCTRQARWIFRLLSATGLYLSSASTRNFTVSCVSVDLFLFFALSVHPPLPPLPPIPRLAKTLIDDVYYF